MIPAVELLWVLLMFFSMTQCRTVTKNSLQRKGFLGGEQSPQSFSPCQCTGFNCGCCTHLKVKQINVDQQGCANVTYLPVQGKISVTFSLNEQVFLNKTITAENPPPLCFEFTPVGGMASLCLVLDKLKFAGQFGGCITLEVRTLGMVIQRIPMGCFYSESKNTDKSQLPLSKGRKTLHDSQRSTRPSYPTDEPSSTILHAYSDKITHLSSHDE